MLCEDVVVYVYSESRSGEVAHHLLAGSTRHLTVDGYAGYYGVAGEGGCVRSGCWAHLRRYFYQAPATAPEARELLDLIVALYRVEHDAAAHEIFGTQAHGLLREERSTPIVDAIESWLDARLELSVPPKCLLGQALGYAKSQRARQLLIPMRVVLSDP